jgi:hypothetical protein
MTNKFIFQKHLILQLFILISCSSLAQNFPMMDFITIYRDKSEKHSLLNYQTDTTMASKKSFLKKLKSIDKESFTGLKEMMDLNSHQFPDQILITDIDKNGKNEYFITENYEGALHCNYIEANNSFVKILNGVDYSEFIIENPEKIWLIEHGSPYGTEKPELEVMQRTVFLYDFVAQKVKLKYKFFYAWQYPNDDDMLPSIDCSIPGKIYSPKYFELTGNAKIFADCANHDNYPFTGKASIGSAGWILSDSLDSYFVVLDTNTKYLNDSLGQTSLTYQDKRYLMCWIRKGNVVFPLDNGILGTYKDTKTGEYLRFFETENGINVAYSTRKSFEQNLKVVSFDKIGRKLEVKFNTSKQTYPLEFKDGFKNVECINPDSTKQVFYRQ